MNHFMCNNQASWLCQHQLHYIPQGSRIGMDFGDIDDLKEHLYMVLQDLLVSCGF